MIESLEWGMENNIISKIEEGDAATDVLKSVIKYSMSN